jgi:hypothetical protein
VRSTGQGLVSEAALKSRLGEISLILLSNFGAALKSRLGEISLILFSNLRAALKI